MKNLVKGLMLSVAIALGATTAQAQNNGTGTSTEDVKPAAATEFWMGETAKAGEFYLYNVGAKIFATNNTPSETDITNATLWTAKESNKSFSFTGKNGYKIYMHSEFSLGITWTAKIDQNETATDFTLAAGTSTEKGYVYSFSKKEGVFTRYFNIDNKKFTPAKKQSNSNDWLLISDAQKKAYTEYVKLFERA